MMGKCAGCNKVVADVKECLVRIGSRNTRFQLCPKCRAPLEDMVENIPGKSHGRRAGPRTVIPMDEIPIKRKRPRK